MLSALVQLLPVIVAAALWVAYHYYKDRHLPEPLSHYIACLLLGGGAAWLSLVLYRGLGLLGLRYDAYALAESNLLGLLAYALLAIGPIEELAKFLPFLLVLRFKEFDEEIDGIIYASVIAIGFSAVENINYLSFLTPTEAALRAIAGPLVHIGFATIWGHYVGVAFLEGRSVLRAACASVLVAGLLHGIYDFIVLGFSLSAAPLAMLLVLAIWMWRLFLIRSIQRRSGIH